MAQYKKDSTFAKPSFPRTGDKKIDALIEKQENHLGEVAAKLNKELLRLERSSAGSSNITVINTIAGGGSSSGGGGSTPVSDVLRSGSRPIVAAGTTVPFSSAISGSFILLFRAYDSGNASIGADITAVTANGFTITPMSAGTVEFAAIKVA